MQELGQKQEAHPHTKSQACFIPIHPSVPPIFHPYSVSPICSTPIRTHPPYHGALLDRLGVQLHLLIQILNVQVAHAQQLLGLVETLARQT
jgi:hypothetical protein